jgi:hypothetical protein
MNPLSRGPRLLLATLIGYLGLAASQALFAQATTSGDDADLDSRALAS